MPRNHLKNFPTAILRRGMAHYRPVSTPNIVNRPVTPADDASATAPPSADAVTPVETPPAIPTA